eukprot:514137-Prymnesium_polylepis.1
MPPESTTSMDAIARALGSAPSSSVPPSAATSASSVIGCSCSMSDGSATSSESGVRATHERSSSDGRGVASLESPTSCASSSCRYESRDQQRSEAPDSVRSETRSGSGVPASPKVSRGPRRQSGSKSGRLAPSPVAGSGVPCSSVTWTSPASTRPKVDCVTTSAISSSTGCHAAGRRHSSASGLGG